MVERGDRVEHCGAQTFHERNFNFCLPGTWLLHLKIVVQGMFKGRAGRVVYEGRSNRKETATSRQS